MFRVTGHENILRCPFCSADLDEPREIQTPFGSTFTGGECRCGAVYAYDRGGHSLGDAYVDVMTYACGGDADRAWSLTPEVDYDIVELSYDSRRNKFMGASRRTSPTYLFVRLKKEVTR